MLRSAPALLVLLFASVSLLSWIAPSAGHADTINFVGTVDDVFGFANYSSDDPPGGGFFFAGQEAVTGIPRFDAGLGTLTAVRVSASLNAGLTPGIRARNAVVANHFAEMTIPFAQAFVGYSPGGGSSTSVLVGAGFNGNSVFCSGGNFPCDQIGGASEGAFATVNLGNLGGFQISDFLGAGNVDTLEAIIVLPLTANFFTINTNGAFGNVFADMFVQSISVEYTFDPVPEPSTAVLLGSILVGVAAVARRVRR